MRVAWKKYSKLPTISVWSQSLDTEANLNAQIITTEAPATVMEADLNAWMAATEATAAATEANMNALMASTVVDLARGSEERRRP